MSPTKSSKRPLEFDTFPEAKRVCVSPSPSEESDDDTVSVKSVMLGRLLVKKLSEKASIPTRGSKYAAGFDLYSAKKMVIPARSRAVVPTDISIAVPEGTYGRVAPRSGLAVNHFIDVGAGVVDYDYRGPVGVVLFNFGENDFAIDEGDRVAQLVLEKVYMCDAEEVEDLDETDRGFRGFGSTGVKL
ncbi:MAG: dUTPase-like protein [Benniella sp.]|nr:MAG: dUTPase-like protein [Benniella sp.]